MKKRNLQRQKKSDSATKKNVEAGGGQDLGGPTSAQFCHAYTLIDSLSNTMAAESNFGTSLCPYWMKTSDSDFSDTEAGQAAKTRVTQGRVRKAALSLLATITKVTVASYPVPVIILMACQLAYNGLSSFLSSSMSKIPFLPLPGWGLPLPSLAHFFTVFPLVIIIRFSIF